MLDEPIITAREEDFILHDLSAESSQVLAGTFVPQGPRVAIDVDSAFSMLGMSRGALLLYVGQPDEPGSLLYDCGGKPVAGAQVHSVASVNGESAWAGTSHRRLFFDVEPGKPVTWQILGAIIGGAAVIDVAPGPARIAITPDGTRAFVTSPASGCVTPITLGRPGHSYRQDLNPMDEPHTPVVTGESPVALAADDEHVVVCNAASVSILSARTFEVLHKVDVAGGTAAALTPDGSTAVVATASGSAVVVDVVGGVVAGSVEVAIGSALTCAGVLLDGTAALVGSAGGVISKVRLSDCAVEGAVDVGATPVCLRVAPDGTVWVACRPQSLVRIDAADMSVGEVFSLPFADPIDLALVPVAGQTPDEVRTAWVTYEDSRFSQFQIAGVFAGQTHTWHNGELEGGGGTKGVAVNDYAEIWVVQHALDRVWKWPGGRLFIRPGIFFGEYCEVAVYGS